MACKVCPRTGQRMCGDEEIACVICNQCAPHTHCDHTCGTCSHMLDMTTSASCARCRQIGNGAECMWVSR